jgi:putative cell wall-binding protein
MTEVIGNGTMELVARWGVIPMLIVSTVILWREFQKMRKANEELHETHKTDLKNHTEEMKSINQNVMNTLNEITRR